MKEKYTFLDKLDYLMKERELTKSLLSSQSNIPYTTIDNWYKRGYEGLKLNTLKKLSKTLNIDIGYWVDDENLEPQESYAKKSPLNVKSSAEELINNYNQLNAKGKAKLIEHSKILIKVEEFTIKS